MLVEGRRLRNRRLGRRWLGNRPSGRRRLGRRWLGNRPSGRRRAAREKAAREKRVIVLAALSLLLVVAAISAAVIFANSGGGPQSSTKGHGATTPRRPSPTKGSQHPPHVTPVTYEAEGGANRILPPSTAETCDAMLNCSNGRAVQIGEGSCEDGVSICGELYIEDVKAPASGTYAVTIYYNASGDMYFYMQVNNGSAARVDTPGNWVNEPVKLGKAVVKVKLSKGQNILHLYNHENYGPSIDRVVVS